ncbi:Lnb N-terminal periplasmic domain-containing protein [Roseobacteraceae bacterium NS-SX3]
MAGFFRAAMIATVALAVAAAAAWAALALWYRLPFTASLRGLMAGGFALLGLTVAVAQLRPDRLRALATFCLALAAVVFWWSTLTPPAQRNWAPDVARQVTGTVEGDRLTLTGVRNFAWRGPDDFDARWETRSYDLSRLETVDLVMSYWSGKLIAHMIVSFGFADGEHLAWSVEVRRAEGGGFSPVADQFKANTLVLIAGDERDLIGTRTNARGEDVQLYRIRTSLATARALLLQYVGAANRLAARPQWYNSLFTNCTTVVLRMLRTITGEVPLDWRVAANGYLPEYAYGQGVLADRLPLETLREKGRISARARAHGLAPGFSAAIREGVPVPQPRAADRAHLSENSR